MVFREYLIYSIKRSIHRTCSMVHRLMATYIKVGTCPHRKSFIFECYILFFNTMHFQKTVGAFLLFALGSCAILLAQMPQKKDQLDVLSYDLSLKPHMETETFSATVRISFLTNAASKEVIFDCGNLQITDLQGKNVAHFKQKNQELIVNLRDSTKKENLIEVGYSGKASHGLIFNTANKEIYTVFSTSQWMVCNNATNDRAKIKMQLSVPNDQSCVASGILADKTAQGDNTQYSWVQDYESPAYTYGFAIGSFNKLKEIHGKTVLNYYSSAYSNEELTTIFSRTRDMVDFFETKTGIPYVQSSYSQLLMGNHYQEMSGFAVLKKSYGQFVLKDSTETNLISHELAHQWWGNMITCVNWNHFWLNEGVATFMSAAFNEHAFGKDKYNSDIASYQKVYETIKGQEKDKSLVFKDWDSPTKEDRNLVYFKGAYIIHLLRMELGENDFWKGIKFYSQKFYGKSVTTLDFQKAFEESTGRNLDAFFSRWVYLKIE